MKHVFISEQRALPTQTSGDTVVHWHIFRSLEEAEDYAEHIQLGEGQRIVGGTDSDSIGALWWVGVEVDDVARWGNQGAVNKHAK